MKKLVLLSFLAATALTATAQENILANKSVYPLGEPKTWTYGDQVIKFGDPDAGDNLQLITNDPFNTKNVFLYPEKGDLSNDPTNQNIVGIQGFYVDMEKEYSVGTVRTTWEGAAADSYVIYVTKDVPTIEILNSNPDYSITGLGQYNDDTAVLPTNPKGRYLVFQPTKATNYGWGVKIRSISATAPVDDELTTFSVSPAIVVAGTVTNVTLNIKNQLGLDIPADDVEITTAGDGDYTYADGVLTINSGTYVTFTAAHGDNTLDATVYAATAPSVPDTSNIHTVVFSNPATYLNDAAEWTTAYNGGAKNNGKVEFPDGTIAQSFSNMRCVFFNNKETTGPWNGNIFPTEKGYEALCIDIFSGQNVDGYLAFEGVTMEEGFEKPDYFRENNYNFTLKAGQWNHIAVDLENVNKLNNMSVRFEEANMCDVLLANIYFSATDVTPSTSEYSLEASVTPSVTDRESIVIIADIEDEAGVDTKYLSCVLNKEDGSQIKLNLTETEPGTNHFRTSTPGNGNVGENTVIVSYKDKSIESKVVVVLGWEAPNDYYGALHTHTVDGVTSEDGFKFGPDGTSVSFSNSLEIELAYPQDLEMFRLNWDNAPEKCTVEVKRLGIESLCSTNPARYINENATVTDCVWNCFSNETEADDNALYLVNKIVITIGEKKDSGNAPSQQPPLLGIKAQADTPYTLASIESFGEKSDSEIVTGTDTVEVAPETETVDVYNLQGVMVRRGVSSAEATRNLPAGLYIVGNRKVLVK